MKKRTSVLTVCEGFFMGGARILHFNVVSDLHRKGKHQHSVVSINQTMDRENTIQRMEDDASYRQLADIGVPIASLGRHGRLEVDYRPFTAKELAAFRRAAAGTDVRLSLKEQPLRLINAADVGKVVACLHRSDPDHQGESLEELRRGIDSGRVVLCTVSGETAKDAYVTAGIPPHKLRVVINGIDLSHFKRSLAHRRRVRRTLDISQDAPVVLLVARFDGPMKNIPLFLASAQRFLADQPNGHVLMCGTGMTVENTKFKEMLDTSFGGEPVKRLHALGPRYDMPAIYSASDVVALTSAYGETYPLCLIEGMACGAIPVTTDVGDAAHIVRDGRGLLTTNSADNIANAWQLALQQRLGFQRAIAAYRPMLSHRRMVAEYAAAIDEAARA